MIEVNRELALKLAFSCNILALEGHSDITMCHVTARVPNQRYLHMKPSSMGMEEVRAEDIIVIDLEGNKLAGKGRRHAEYPIHTEIYKAREEINCVVHTHPPYAKALGALDGKIHSVSNEGVLFVNLPFFTETTGLIITPNQGEAVAKCLGQARAMLLQNHGVVVVGQSIEEATVYAILLERAARGEHLVRQLGLPVCSSEGEIKNKIELIYNPKNIQIFWDYFVRCVKRHQ
jgi:ribulose-5-phosphate 4-epimerase/fuculose-1-phosphate aldolase